ncbi:MAG: T9SS type A sorting domain-containing protein [Hymenobacter sp.]|nr:T9SS type A sorting domain-containing protein [Hymenobacter sp.]
MKTLLKSVVRGSLLVALELTAGNAPGQTSLTFVSRAPLPVAHYGMGYTNDQQFIYQVGGGSPATALTGDVYRYDLAANTWAVGAAMVTPQRWSTAAILNPGTAGSLIYVLNGAASVANSPVQAMETVQAASSLDGPSFANPQSTTTAGSAVWNGVLYCYGGISGTTYASSLRAYNRLTDTWTTLAPLPQARTTAGAAVNGKVYAFGGYDGLVNYSRVDAYDIATNQWQALASLPTVVSNQAVAVQGEWIWLVGDFNNQSYLAAYNTRTAQLRTFTSNLPPRRNAAAAIVNNQLYVWGGNTASANSSALSDMWRADVGFLLLGTTAAAAKPILQAYPNPSVSGRFQVLLPDAGGAGEVQVLVRDGRGQLVRHVRVRRGGTTHELDLADQPAGLYLVETRQAGLVTARCRLVRQ